MTWLKHTLNPGKYSSECILLPVVAPCVCQMAAQPGKIPNKTTRMLWLANARSQPSQAALNANRLALCLEPVYMCSHPACDGIGVITCKPQIGISLNRASRMSSNQMQKRKMPSLCSETFLIWRKLVHQLAIIVGVNNRKTACTYAASLDGLFFHVDLN